MIKLFQKTLKIHHLNILEYQIFQGKSVKVLNILSEVSLGYFYFDIAMTFRSSMFINSVMTNSEVCYPINGTQLKGLMVEDKSLLKKKFTVPASTTNCLIYLETGQTPIEDIIKFRRIKYLHYLLTSPPGEMLSKVFQAQLRNTLKGDWVDIVKKDLKDN